LPEEEGLLVTLQLALPVEQEEEALVAIPQELIFLGAAEEVMPVTVVQV
jgi:hypothetical protein